MREGKGPPREGILNKGLKSRVHVYSEWMHIPTGANSMSWHHVPMKTKSHANAKSQEYCFWLLKSTESVGSMYVPVASMRLVKSYIWFFFWSGKGNCLVGVPSGNSWPHTQPTWLIFADGKFSREGITAVLQWAEFICGQQRRTKALRAQGFGRREESESQTRAWARCVNTLKLRWLILVIASLLQRSQSVAGWSSL